MLLVNNPGSWSNTYPFLLHAGWHGFTIADLVFPMFLLIVGFSIGLSFERERLKRQQRIVIRFFIIFLTGLVLNAINQPFIDFVSSGFQQSKGYDFISTFRYMGVLQRIAICYLVTALVFLSLRRYLLAVIIVFIVAYELFMRWGFGTGNYDFSIENNFARVADFAILGRDHIFRFAKGPDPEGLVSTINAIALTLGGALFYQWWFHAQKQNILLAIATVVCCIALGLGMVPIEPLNKQLFTTSYLFFSAGITITLLMVFHIVPYEFHLKPFISFIALGRNSFFIFVFSGLLAKSLASLKSGDFSIKTIFFEALNSLVFDPHLASLLFAFLFVVFFTLCCLYFYRRRIFFVI